MEPPRSERDLLETPRRVKALAKAYPDHPWIDVLSPTPRPA
jgi:hypothetical protein